MIILAAACILANISAASAKQEIVLDVLRIAGKDMAAVSEYLGKPIECSPVKQGQKCAYTKAETEIVYIDGLADWITIEGIDDVAFEATAIQSLGFAESKPSFKNGFSLRWDGIEDLMEVTIFKGASRADYAYIKVKTS